MSDTSQVVVCAEHGRSYAAFVCRHLVHGVDVGFYHADDDTDPCPDAWCAECDQVLIGKDSHWDDESEKHVQITVICAGCYQAVRQRNQD